VVENAGTLEVCARLIPEDNSRVPLDPPQGDQTEAMISLQLFFGSPGNPAISATLFTVESPPGPLTAIGDNILVVFLTIYISNSHVCRWITSGS